MYACMTPVGFDTSNKFENHCSSSWHFCFITMISSSSNGRVRRAIIASEVVDLGIIQVW